VQGEHECRRRSESGDGVDEVGHSTLLALPHLFAHDLGLDSGELMKHEYLCYRAKKLSASMEQIVSCTSPDTNDPNDKVHSLIAQMEEISATFKGNPWCQ
jgi:hypothetical protein